MDIRWYRLRCKESFYVSTTEWRPHKTLILHYFITFGKFIVLVCFVAIVRSNFFSSRFYVNFTIESKHDRVVYSNVVRSWIYVIPLISLTKILHPYVSQIAVLIENIEHRNFIRVKLKAFFVLVHWLKMEYLVTEEHTNRQISLLILNSDVKVLRRETLLKAPVVVPNRWIETDSRMNISPARCQSWCTWMVSCVETNHRWNPSYTNIQYRPPFGHPLFWSGFQHFHQERFLGNVTSLFRDFHDFVFYIVARFFKSIYKSRESHQLRGLLVKNMASMPYAARQTYF